MSKTRRRTPAQRIAARLARAEAEISRRAAWEERRRAWWARWTAASNRSEVLEEIASSSDGKTADYEVKP